MSIPTSTAPGVKAYLFTGLQSACTAVTGCDLLVRYDDPGPYQPEDVVSVGAITERRTSNFGMVGSGGAGALQEEYTIEIVIDVWRRGPDVAQTAVERAFTLLGQVESFIRTDPTMGGRIVQGWPRLARDEPQWEEDHSGYRDRLTVAVDCQAVI